MRSMGGPRRRSIEPRFVFAALVTLVLVPFVIADLTGGGDDEPVESAVESERTDDGAAVEAEPTETGAEDEAVIHTLDPEWIGRGMSRYGESDEATAARIERWSRLIAGESVADLPPIDDETPTGTSDGGSTDDGSSEDTVPPASTNPPATSPPATAAPTTTVAPTAPPTTSAPTTTRPPATTTTRPPVTTTTVAVVGVDG